MIRNLRYVYRHPMNRHAPWAAVGRWCRWQVGSRVLRQPVSMPFTDHARLLVRTGMYGATGNIYCGLHEAADMLFIAHLLRADERFVDVGANIGSYTVLAGKVVGAEVVAFEPLPATFEALRVNVAINGIEGRVRTHNLALGAADGRLRLTTDRDVMNHLVPDGADYAGEVTQVPVRRLDDALEGFAPHLIKVDVEGFETHVLDGGPETFADPGVQAVLLELNGAGAAFGFDEADVHRRMLGFGFRPCSYDPFTRTLAAIDEPSAGGNTIYCRDVDAAQRKVRDAPKVSVYGRGL